MIATPGHTDGSMALLLPRPRVLFTGDTVAEHQGQIVLGPSNLDLDRTAISFRALAELDADVACFGHGRPTPPHTARPTTAPPATDHPHTWPDSSSPETKPANSPAAAYPPPTAATSTTPSPTTPQTAPVRPANPG